MYIYTHLLIYIKPPIEAVCYIPIAKAVCSSLAVI